MSWNELTFQGLGPDKTPVLVVVQSSTGDGDPPDNSANVYTSLRKPQPAGLLRGVQFTLLGLGDSNYSTFMGAPRVFRTK